MMDGLMAGMMDMDNVYFLGAGRDKNIVSTEVLFCITVHGLHCSVQVTGKRSRLRRQYWLAIGGV
jgi:hypothetical protein